ncbi:MAG: hypothetical protein ACP5U1_12245 [Desulfomonilaceae bacterium]
MHGLMDKNMVDMILFAGTTQTSVPERLPILQEHSLPYDQKAENVVITGCQIFLKLRDVLAVLARLFDSSGLSHTFLSKEFHKL